MDDDDINKIYVCGNALEGLALEGLETTVERSQVNSSLQYLQKLSQKDYSPLEKAAVNGARVLDNVISRITAGSSDYESKATTWADDQLSKRMQSYLQAETTAAVQDLKGVLKDSEQCIADKEALLISNKIILHGTEHLLEKEYGPQVESLRQERKRLETEIKGEVSIGDYNSTCNSKEKLEQTNNELNIAFRQYNLLSEKVRTYNNSQEAIESSLLNDYAFLNFCKDALTNGQQAEDWPLLNQELLDLLQKDKNPK
jgi:hypothetical protein